MNSFRTDLYAQEILDGLKGLYKDVDKLNYLENHLDHIKTFCQSGKVTNDSKPYLKRLYIETLIEKYKKAESIAENNVYKGIYAMFAKELQGLRDL